jgi:lactoylglutathione lyase
MKNTLSLLTVLLLMGSGVGQAQEPLPAPKQKLTAGFNHIGLTVTDLALSTRFFTEVLGWKQVGGDVTYPANFVSDGNMFLTLWQASEPENAVKFNRKNNVGLHHLAITVPSFEALDTLYERVNNFDGVEVEFSPELAYGGPGKHMMIREPSGNRLEFTHTPPRAKD